MRVFVFVHTQQGCLTNVYANVRQARRQARRALAFYEQFGGVTVEVFTRGNPNMLWFARPQGKWRVW